MGELSNCVTYVDFFLRTCQKDSSSSAMPDYFVVSFKSLGTSVEQWVKALYQGNDGALS